LPKLGGTGAEVWDMSIYDENKQIEGGEKVLIAGNFSGPSSTQKNLVLVDGTTGDVIRWYNAPSLKSALAAPDLSRVYGGGVGLTAFNKDSSTPLWSSPRAKTTVDSTLYSDPPSPGYRDLELDGSTIWAACACDAVGGNLAKALVKLTTDGTPETSWRAAADPASWGMSVLKATNGALYLGTGGSDDLAKYDNGPTATGVRSWVRDTSGSVQVVEEMGGQLVIGGHFWKVADQPSDNCGHGRSTDLDPSGVCQIRKGIAAYSFDGELRAWNPLYAGKYSLVWALHVEKVDGTSRLHTGGEFLTVNGVTQNYYARLS
jgi:hypothetical protein